MKRKDKKIAKNIIIVILLIIVALVTSIIFMKNVNNSKTQLNSEHLRTMSYSKLIEDDAKVENSEYVKFSAFFTRDLNNDGNAEKLLGSCRDVNYTDVLYMDLNVLTKGYLKDGKITINGTNFNYSMSMVKDSVLKNNYISDDVKEIELNQVNAGTQKLILGNILADIGNNINNYSNISTVTLTGTHISDEGIETKIEKTVDLTVDWHGKVDSNLYTKYQATTFYYNYDELDTTTISFNFRLDEMQEELILKENKATLTIPNLNGYSATEVVCTNDNVETEYNKETKVLKIKRTSTCNEKGIIISSLSRSNTYNINVIYPKEAYDSISSYTTLTVPITGYYTGYNNPNEEFENPYKSNEINGNITLVFRETPKGEIYNFYTDFVDKKYVIDRKDPLEQTYRYVISKQDIINLYDSEEEIKNKEYTVKWMAVRGSTGEVNSMVMSETKEEEQYGDKWNDIIIDEYTINTGIYFTGADNILGENGLISIYNNDTNELIKTFNKDEWNNYTKENPYKYAEKVKHIRVETSSANINSSLSVYNIKELDTNKILQDFTKEEIKNIEIIYTYLTGICDIEGQGEKTRKDIDYVYYISEKSYADLAIEKEKISTQETCYNQKFYINTLSNQEGDSKWKNGEFLVELPEEIINIELNNVAINNNEVTIVAYDLYQENGKYFIKIITENEEPTSYQITIDCNITPDPRIPTSNKDIKLYMYNKQCNDYYNLAEDLFDVDADNNIIEKVGNYNVNIDLLSPTSLVTFETVSNYNKENEITVAPNIAFVERDTRQATMNIELTNNYPNTVSGVQILGKIPFEGNTYVLNGKDLKSQFTVNMTEAGITVPNNLKEKVTVYYSENENPNKNIDDSTNGWTLKEKVKDFSKIKTYLIDLRNYTIEIGKGYTFSYVVNLPENLDYNLTSFSSHAVYYELNTEGGNLQLSTEPNRVGVRIVKKFDLELTKYKINSNLKIPGVTYILKYQEENLDGQLKEKTRILTINNEGKILLEDLHIEKEYKLQEFRVPNTCELNTEEITFIVNEDGTVNIAGNVRNQKFTAGEVLQIDLEDEVKYNLQITKTKKGQNLEIDGVRFKLVDEAKNAQYVRTKNGNASIVGLSLNKIYILTEIAAPATCEVNNGIFKFKLIRDKGLLKIEIIENTLLSEAPVITDLENELTPILNVNVQNEIKYSLELVKQDEEGNKLKDIQFIIKGEEFSNEGSKFTTLKDGKISIYGLNVGKVYTIEEIKAVGYYLDSNKNNTIEFKVDRTSDGLKITTWNKGDGILEVGTKNISEKDLSATLNVVLENKKVPTYDLKLVKVNEDGEKLQGAQFKLTSLDTNIEKTLIIDENGEGVFENLFEYIEGKSITGECILEETFAPEGYGLNTAKLKFKAIRDENKKVQIQILEGNELIKENSDTNEKEIISDENTLTLNILNKPIFKLKKYGDNDSLLSNVKFEITDLDGNSVTDVKGETVGNLEDLTENIEFMESTTNPWKQNEDGIWVSGNKGIANTTSVLTSNDFIVRKKGKISFEWSVSSEGGTYDYLYYTITNKVTNTTIGGTSNKIGGTTYGTTYDSLQFMKQEIELEPGTYTIAFSFRKDGNTDKGTDSGYVKNVMLVIPTYVLETNKNGEVTADLSEGLYKAIEVKAPEGYNLSKKEKDNTYYFGIGKTKAEEIGNKIDTLEWAKSIKSDMSSELESIIQTLDGGGIAVGKVCENIDIDGDGTIDDLGKGNKDGIIIKYDKSGNIQWSKILGGINNEELYSIAKNPNGGYLIAGYTDSTEVYLEDTLIDTEYFGNEDGILIKIDENGNYEWSQSLGGTGIDHINSIAVSESGDIAVTGSYTSSEISLDKANTDSLINFGAASANKNAFIVVYSNNGEYKWSQNIGGKKAATGADIICTNSGFVVTANFIGTAYLNTAKTASITSIGKADGVIILYDGAGNVIWNKQIGSAENETLYEVVTDKEQNIIVVGAFGGTLDLNEDGTTDLTNKNSSYDGLIVKLNESGNYLNHKTIGGSDDDTLSTISVTEDAGLLLGGWYYSTSVDLNGDGVNEITSNTGICDGIIMKLNSNLELEWYDSIKGNSYDTVNCVIETIDKAYIAVGDYESSNLTILNESNKLTNSKFPDAFIVKYGKEVLNPGIPEVQEIEVYNELLQYQITTEIATEYRDQRQGGTITGEYNEEFLEQNYIQFVENVKYGYSNSKNIEIKPDNDYFIKEILVNNEKIEFTPDENGNVVLPSDYFKDVKENKHIVAVFENTKDFNFTITKLDDKTNEPIEDVKFEIYRINENTDVKPIYTNKTDENGQLKMNLPSGYYKAIEVEAPKQYILEEDEDLRTTYFKTEDVIADLEINYIEDLVEFSNNVNSGNYYKDKIVVLKRTLDFNDDNSYRNVSSTSYGDYNGDGIVQGIKEELTNTAGTGFKAIGRSYSFQGIFDGNGYEIQNIYINSKSYNYAGLFGEISNSTICNVGVSGVIKNTYNGYAYASGIVCRSSNSLVINCYNKANIIGDCTATTYNSYTSGVLAYCDQNSKVINSYNEGNISGSSTGKFSSAAGLIAYGNNSKILNCYNTGNISSSNLNTGSYNGIAGGIAADLNSYDKVINCYNTGDVYVSSNGYRYIGGIVGRLYNSSYGVINKCYNIGNLSINSLTDYVYGITESSGTNVTESYWLNTIATQGVSSSTDYTNSMTEEEMKSELLLRYLNYNNSSSKYIAGADGYPIIDYDNLTNVYLNETSEITIKNKLKEFKITTKVENNNHIKDGGTISGASELIYEVVRYNENSTKDILVTPIDGYRIEYIKVNGNIIEFEPNEDGSVLLDKFTEVTEDKEISVKFVPILTNNFIFKKIDNDTKQPIANTKFAIYKISLDKTVIDFAKDSNGQYVGNLNDDGLYIVTTDENGTISLNLQSGYYKVVEIEAADGYYLEKDEELRTTYVKTSNQDLVINYIEDLINLSTLVSSGKNLQSCNIELGRSLDFNDDSSYIDPNSTIFGDYNKDGTIQGIKAELTNKNGIGFIGIGGNNSNNIFSGTFNGNGYEIKNLYMNAYNNANAKGYTTYGGLFIYLTNANIYNLNLTDVDIYTSCAAGLAEYSYNSNIENCKITGKIDGGTSPAGGLVTFIHDNSLIKKCNINATISGGGCAGGIAQYINNSKVISCIIKGSVDGINAPAGGIAQGLTHCEIINCCNNANITSTSPAGGFAQYLSSNTIIRNSYNTGTVKANYNIGGISASASPDIIIENCYNTGLLIKQNPDSTTSIAGIAFSNPQMKNCYYLNTVATQGNYGSEDVQGKVEAKTITEMQSREFTDLLNSNKENLESDISLANWLYNENSLPTLYIPEVVTEGFEPANNLEITNKQTRKVIVHHYLEGTGPKYETEAVVLSEDEVLEGLKGNEYTTSPKTNIENYTILRDKDGEYILPQNATGIYTEEEQHVYYYYSKAPLKVTVHHYLEGTEDKIIDDETSYYKENEHYKTSASEELLVGYELVTVVGDEEKDITQNEEVSYYYKKKDFKVTIKVEIPEGRTDKGGTILGEGETPYEIVKYGENSTKDIIATPDTNYKVSKITVNGKLVPFTIKNGKVQIEKFENVTEDKDVVVVFAPVQGKVITHHYIQGTEEKLYEDIVIIDNVGSIVKTEPVHVDGYKLVDSKGNKDADGNVVITKETSAGVEEITYYYQKSFTITTEVVEHNENYKDGTSKEKIKGGTITSDGVVIHEQVMKYEANKKVIEIKPDEGYEVAEVKVNGIAIDIESIKDSNSEVVTIPEGFIKNIQEDIHVQVEFRKISNVIVKYLEKDTETELSKELEIVGYEGKEFETIGKIIPGYILIKEQVSDENGEVKEINKTTDENNQPIEPNGTMFSDDITIIYWYEKTTASVVERHIEVNEKGEEIEIEYKEYEDTQDTALTISRKTFENYISVEAPDTTKEEIVTNYPNITIAEELDNEIDLVVDSNVVKEVWYYYLKQYKITTDVKLHKEVINDKETEVAGGSISKEFKIDENGEEVEITYEVVNSRADSTKEIKMVPDDGYRIKAVTINDIEIYIDNMVAEDGSLLLPKAYFKDVQQDYHVVVEFERIPAKVVVKYIDEDTKESILEDKVIDGFVNTEYDEVRAEVENYIPAEPEPTNAKGKMTEETITITYFYKKQFKVTTDVKEHEETDKDGNKVKVKGGKITGEDETPFEIVLRGKENTKTIKAEPDRGFRISKLIINNVQYDFRPMLDNKGILTIPVFENMQEDKHIVVEFERIPARVIVKYLDEKTGDELTKQEKIIGFVNGDYSTNSKEFVGYKLNDTKLPKNAKGKMTEEEIVVIYYYNKIEIPKEEDNQDLPEIKPEVKPDDNQNIPEQPDNNQEIQPKPNNPTHIENVKTGDNIFGYAILLVVSIVGIVVIIIGKNKKK